MAKRKRKTRRKKKKKKGKPLKTEALSPSILTVADWRSVPRSLVMVTVERPPSLAPVELMDRLELLVSLMMVK